jgi:hypothetical protein
LQIEVVNGKNNICYCLFGVYLVTGTKNLPRRNIPDFKIKFLSPLRDGQTRFLGPFHWTHVVSKAAVSPKSLLFTTLHLKAIALFDLFLEGDSAFLDHLTSAFFLSLEPLGLVIQNVPGYLKKKFYHVPCRLGKYSSYFIYSNNE